MPGARPRSSPAADRRTVLRIVGLAGLTALSLALRLGNIGFGLPAIYRPDEDVVVGRAMGVLHGTLDPHFADWPHGHFYLSAAWLALTTPLRALGSEPAVDYLAVRVLTAILGTLTVLVVFEMGRRAFCARAGLFAAAGMSVAFLNVRDSHFATIDVPLTLACSLTLLALLISLPLAGRVGRGSRQPAFTDSPSPLRGGSGRAYLIEGALLGLATGIKYTAAFLVAAIVAGSRRRLVATLLVGLGVFALTSPFLVLEPALFAHGLRSITQHLAQPGAGEIGWIHLVRLALWQGLGPVLFLLSVAGVGVALWRRTPPDWILLSFVLATYVVLGAGSSVFVRYADPLLPPLLVLAGRAVDEVLRATVQRRAQIATAIAVLVIAVSSLPHDVAYDVLIGRTDTRTQAFDWLASHTQPGDRVAAGYFPGPAHDAALVASGRHSHGATDAYVAAFLQNRLEDRYGVHELTAAELAGGDLAALRAEGVRLVLVTPMLPQDDCGGPSPLEQQLRALGPPVAVFLPAVDPCSGSVFDPLDAYFVPLAGDQGWLRPGPPIRIYRLG
jgi:dolichyl-phosphate-mannose-protein mannosyltransferase